VCNKRGIGDSEILKTRLLIIIGCLTLIVIGVYLNFEYHKNVIYPLNLVENNLEKIIGTSDKILISNYLKDIKVLLQIVIEYLPEDKNPVWFFPTESTNFLRINKNIDQMTRSLNEISSFSQDNSPYYTGMLDINDRSSTILENIRDAKGFVYASITNMIFTLMWEIGIVGLIVVKTRK